MNSKYLPDGTPKYVQCFDSGDQYIDRYTVKFTYIRDGEQHLFCMNDAPFSPQGFGQHAGYPAYQHLSLGKRISFAALPPDCQRAVRMDYVELWGEP